MFRFIRGFFSIIWKLISWVRAFVFNILFLCLLVLVIVAFVKAPKPIIPNQSVLVLAPSGTLVDQFTYNPSALDLLGPGQEHPLETRIRDLTSAITQAARDENITGLVLRLDYLEGGGMSKLEEVGQAISEFRNSQKPVIAYADNFSQQQYFLASFADQIYLNPMGSLMLTGFGVYRNYMKEATEKLSLNFNVFRVGEFKDAIEPFIRNDMSEPSKQHTRVWVGDLWQQYTQQIEKSRDLDQGALQSYIDTMHLRINEAGVNSGTLAKSANLVDELISRTDLRDRLISRFGVSNKGDKLNAIGMTDYLRSKFKPKLPTQKNIGLIVAAGTILDGHQGNGQIGSESLGELLRKAGEDSSLSALIIRIDSGGGSAFASEVIREEIVKLRAKDIPVYISMGSVAASGGYWIAAAAQEIWAMPSTLTGSIGVWGLIPNISEAANRLGVYSDGVGTTTLSDAFNIDRPMSEEVKTIIQNSVDDVYSRFLQLVAEARNSNIEDIHKIAQGRVWTGSKALELGLVDKLGTLDDLVSYVSDAHSVDKNSIKLIERELNFEEQLLRTLTTETSSLARAIKTSLLNESELSMLLDSVRPLLQGTQSLPIEVLKAMDTGPNSASYITLCFDCKKL